METQAHKLDLGEWKVHQLCPGEFIYKFGQCGGGGLISDSDSCLPTQCCPDVPAPRMVPETALIDSHPGCLLNPGLTGPQLRPTESESWSGGGPEYQGVHKSPG